ncbi:hypothetical protein [Streptosporangium sp. LJ11]
MPGGEHLRHVALRALPDPAVARGIGEGAVASLLRLPGQAPT